MMASQAPSDKPWADGPMKLVQTPLYLSTQQDETPKVRTRISIPLDEIQARRQVKSGGIPC